MAASPESGDGALKADRRRRYERAAVLGQVNLTPAKQQLLQHLFACRLLSLPQTAALMDISEQAARRHVRELFDAGLVERIAVSRAALADPTQPNDASLLYGSAPSIHTVSRKGVEQLISLGLLGREALRRPIPVYGPQNALFLRHELLIRDVRVWLEQLTRSTTEPRNVLSWLDGEDAAIPLIGGSSVLKPDARFVLQVRTSQTGQPIVLSGLLEADRGTERGATRWQEKFVAYTSLFTESDSLRSATGYQNARVIIVTPDERRTTWLADFLEKCLHKRHADPECLERFWICHKEEALSSTGSTFCWQMPGVGGRWPLLAYPGSTGPAAP